MPAAGVGAAGACPPGCSRPGRTGSRAAALAGGSGRGSCLGAGRACRGGWRRHGWLLLRCSGGRLALALGAGGGGGVLLGHDRGLFIAQAQRLEGAGGLCDGGGLLLGVVVEGGGGRRDGLRGLLLLLLRGGQLLLMVRRC